MPTITNPNINMVPSLRCQNLLRLPITAAARRLTTVAVEAEARAVEKIEDAIHNIIAKRSKPDWLPFVPGASYWVPPRRPSYGVSEIVRQLANALTDEECMSLATPQGWPSSSFYIHNDNDAPSHLDEAAGEEKSSANTSLHDVEESFGS